MTDINHVRRVARRLMQKRGITYGKAMRIAGRITAPNQPKQDDKPDQ